MQIYATLLARITALASKVEVRPDAAMLFAIWNFTSPLPVIFSIAETIIGLGTVSPLFTTGEPSTAVVEETVEHCVDLVLSKAPVLPK